MEECERDVIERALPSSCLAQSVLSLRRPRAIRVAHDFADAFVEQRRLNQSKKRKDQFKAHSGTSGPWKPGVEPGFRD